MAFPKNISIDLGMDALIKRTSTGQTLTRGQIAEVCKCSTEYIHEIERKALAKLKNNTLLLAYYAEQ